MPTRPTETPKARSFRPAWLLAIAGVVVVGTAIALISFKSASGAGEEPVRAPKFVSQRGEFEKIARRLYDGSNPYLGRGKIDRTMATLARPGIALDQRITSLAELALEYLRLGDVDESIARVNEAVDLSRQSGVSNDRRADVLRTQGLVFLRQAEVENCIARHNRDCCIFPLRGQGLHQVAAPATQARRAFEASLRLRPNDVNVKWLLNIVAMALGDYPDAVPASYRLPPSVFTARGGLKRFQDVAPDLGVDALNLCGGVIAEDFDGDGLIDIVTSTYDPRGAMHYYRNDGKGGFEDLSESSHLADQFGGLNCVGADYDSDGDMDILVLRGAWLHEDGKIRNSLIRNNGDGTFTDVTREAGLADPARPTQSAAWGDYDNDGDLDVFIVNESQEQFGRESHPAQLFRNNGDGTFTDIADAAGVTNRYFAKGVAAGDYDDDGDLDFYVSNVGPNRLYRNNGDSTFTDVAPSLGLTEPSGRSFATWFFDHDNDGDLDLFVAAYKANVSDIVADTLGVPHQAATPRLYSNNGDGSFTDITRRTGLARAWLPMGANFGDVDHDGWLDMYLTTGDPEYSTLTPNVLMRSLQGQTFENQTYAAGLGHLQKGHGVAFADFDHDGDQDIYHQLGGFYPGDKFQNTLFENPGSDTRYLYVRVRGTESNRMGIGARIRVVLDTPTGPREIHRAVGAVSSFGGSPFRQEIGLGDATAIRELTVAWPTSGQVQTFRDVPLDSVIRVTEGDDRLEHLAHPAIGLATDRS